MPCERHANKPLTGPWLGEGDVENYETLFKRDKACFFCDEDEWRKKQRKLTEEMWES